MRRFWIALAILLALGGLGVQTGQVTDSLCRETLSLMEQGQQAAQRGDLEGAHALTEQAHTLWKSRLSLLHVLLRHDGLDAVTDGMDEACAMLDMGEAGEYAAASQRVCAALEELRDGEMLSITNVL